MFRDSAKSRGAGGRSARPARPPSLSRCGATSSTNSSSVSSSSASILAFSILPSSATRHPPLPPRTRARSTRAQAPHGPGPARGAVLEIFASGAIRETLGKSWYGNAPPSLVVDRMPDHPSHPRRPGVALLIACPGHPRPQASPFRTHWYAPAVAGQAMPIFWLGIMLIIVFAVRLRPCPLPATERGRTRHARLCPGASPPHRAPALRHHRGHEHGLLRQPGLGRGRAHGRDQARLATASQDHRAGPAVGQLPGALSSRRRCSRGRAWPPSPDSIRNQDFPWSVRSCSPPSSS